MAENLQAKNGEEARLTKVEETSLEVGEVELRLQAVIPENTLVNVTVETVKHGEEAIRKQVSLGGFSEPVGQKLKCSARLKNAIKSLRHLGWEGILSGDRRRSAVDGNDSVARLQVHLAAGESFWIAVMGPICIANPNRRKGAGSMSMSIRSVSTGPSPGESVVFHFPLDGNRQPSVRGDGPDRSGSARKTQSAGSPSIPTMRSPPRKRRTRQSSR